MSKSSKQIYAVIEVGESDIKLLVAEYYNTRFNILTVESYNTNAISDFKVLDSKLFTHDIKKIVDKASNNLGATIEKVVLVLPAYNFKRLPLKSKVLVETGYVTKKDVARAISNSLKAKVDDDVMIVNSVVCKYTTNGLATRRMPEKESCNDMVVDIDLLCCDREMAYNYVSCIENAGLKVLDITLNTYAIAKESSIFEESLKQNIICLDIEKNCTYLSLLNNGKLISSEIFFEGFNCMGYNLKQSFGINDDDIGKLIKYDLDYDSKHLNDVVYAYNDETGTKTISQYELNESCIDALNEYVDKLMTMCKPVLERGACIYITGEGQQIISIIKKIADSCTCEVKQYYPETIGIRNSIYTAIYGALFVYRDKVLLNDLNVNCIDLLQYDSLIEQKDFDGEGETITTKIKNLFKQYVERQED